MAKHYALAAKAWQIHDVLQMTLNALEGHVTSEDLPIQGVLCLLMEQAREVADKLSDPAYSGDEARRNKRPAHAQEDA